MDRRRLGAWWQQPGAAAVELGDDTSELARGHPRAATSCRPRAYMAPSARGRRSFAGVGRTSSPTAKQRVRGEEELAGVREDELAGGQMRVGNGASGMN